VHSQHPVKEGLVAAAAVAIAIGASSPLFYCWPHAFFGAPVHGNDSLPATAHPVAGFLFPSTDSRSNFKWKRTRPDEGSSSRSARISRRQSSERPEWREGHAPHQIEGQAPPDEGADCRQSLVGSTTYILHRSSLDLTAALQTTGLYPKEDETALFNIPARYMILFVSNVEALRISYLAQSTK